MARLVGIVRHNTIKPEDLKMKTNRNFFSKISKATLIVSLAFTTLISVSCQNTASQSFIYKTNFIKQMVYQVSNEFMTRAGISVQTRNNSNEAGAILVNYTIANKGLNQSSYNDQELASFLTTAASLNAPVAEMETEKDNTLVFLTKAATLNMEVAGASNSDDTLDLLLNAAQLNTPAAVEETSQDELLDFLTRAADLNTSVVE